MGTKQLNSNTTIKLAQQVLLPLQQL